MRVSLILILLLISCLFCETRCDVIQKRMLQQSYPQQSPRQYTGQIQSGYGRPAYQQGNASYSKIPQSTYGSKQSSLTPSQSKSDSSTSVFNSDTRVFKDEGGVFKSQGGVFKGNTSLFGK